MSSPLPTALARWHQVVAELNPGLLTDLLAEDVVFRSPAIHTPVIGREAATAYLRAATIVLGPTLHYRRQWVEQSAAVLEFEATIDGLTIHGIDMITWDSADQIVEFTVMVRPYKALTGVMEAMAAELSRG